MQLRTTKISDAVAALSKLTDEQLLTELANSLSLTVESLARAAACLSLIRQRGMDVSQVESHPLYKTLCRISAGNLLPEVVTCYAGSEKLRAKIAALPTNEQLELCQPDATLPVLTVDGKTRRVRPMDMSPAEVSQVFGKDYVRNPAQQRSFIEDRKRAAYHKPQPDTVGVTVDTKKRRIIVPAETVLTGPQLLEYARMVM